MRAADDKCLCQEAQIYYYDLICSEEGAVPEFIRCHAALCPVCRQRIRRLREALAQSQRNPAFDDQGADEVVEALTEQFRLLDERVTCSDAKPYLPELALPSPAIRIPTPVTVHVDQCPSCAQDVAALRRLHLTVDQLKRLKRLFESSRGMGMGSPTHNSALGVPLEPMNHRQDADATKPGGHEPAPAEAGDTCDTAAPLPSKDSPVACREVSTADLFDSVVPGGGPPAAIAAHIRACPACRAKALTLQRTFWAIAARADSETTTIYHAGNDAEDAEDQGQQTYRYPVSVQVLHHSSGGAPDRADSSPGPRREPGVVHGLRRRARSLTRVAVIAVAVASLGLLLRTTAPTASGLYGSDVLKALAQAPNVRMVITMRDGRLAQEYWIARASNQLLYRTPQSCVLYDLAQDRKRMIEPRSELGVSMRLSKTERDWVRRVMAGGLANVLERISPAAKRDLLPKEIDRQDIQGLDIYELQPSRWHGNPDPRACEWAYIDPGTGLPQWTESYQQIRHGGPWQLRMTIGFTYPSELEMAEGLRRLCSAD